MCLLPETTVYSSEFLNNALSKLALRTVDLLRQVGPSNEAEVEGNALGDVVQFGECHEYYNYRRN